MISKQDLERLLEREEGDKPIASLFLDMSVNSDNKRTYSVFLNQKRSQFEELSNGSEGYGPEALAEFFDRVQRWLADDFDEENHGVVIYAEVGGNWFDALQFPIAVQNRLVISRRPVAAPLAEVLESYDHHAVILLDRERVRILSVYLGTLLDEIEVQADPWPAPHDIQAGGYAETAYQSRKAEETKRFFREFAKKVETFVDRHAPDDLLILGTDENVANFREFLSEPLLRMVIYTGPMRVDELASQVMLSLQPHLDVERRRESQELLNLLRERVQQDYLATAGFQTTLTALQEGKVDTLVIEQDLNQEGVRCPRCGFVFVREVDTCPYDGAETTKGVDLVEEAIRMGEAQVEFVPAATISDLHGVGALLRF